MEDVKLEALKNRRMKGITLEINVKPSDELAPGAPEKEGDESLEGEMKEAIVEHEQDDKMQDEETFRKMLDETSFQKRFGKKVG